MNILDRYLIKEFIVPLIYCLAAFTILFMAYQLISEVDEIIKEGAPFPIVLRSILGFIPIVLSYAIPTAALLATLFSLSQLSKHNEISAMRSSGINLYRIMVPFALVGVVLSLIVFIINDNFSAGSGFEIRLIHLIRKKMAAKENEKNLMQLSYFNPKHNRHWEGYYDVGNKIVYKPVIRQYRRNLIKKLQISAEECKWIDGSWWMFNGSRVSYKLLGYPYPSKSFIKTELPTMEFNETPKDFELSRKSLSKMTFMELKNHHSKILSGSMLARKALVELHQKVAFPALSFIVVLIGFPFGVRTTRGGGVFVGMGISIVIWIIYYPLTIFCQSLGWEGILAPWLAAWLPTVLIGATGLILTARARY